MRESVLIWCRLPNIIGNGLLGASGRETGRAPACDLQLGDGDMATDQECVDYARECVRLAELTKDLQLRDWLLTTAREWMAIASKQRGRALA